MLLAAVGYESARRGRDIELVYEADGRHFRRASPVVAFVGFAIVEHARWLPYDITCGWSSTRRGRRSPEIHLQERLKLPDARGAAPDGLEPAPLSCDA